MAAPIRLLILEVGAHDRIALPESLLAREGLHRIAPDDGAPVDMVVIGPSHFETGGAGMMSIASAHAGRLGAGGTVVALLPHSDKPRHRPMVAEQVRRLAIELAPATRINALLASPTRVEPVPATALARMLRFLAENAAITGQTLELDGALPTG